MVKSISKEIMKKITKEIGEIPRVGYHYKNKIDYIEFDGSSEQLKDCIAKNESGEYDRFYIDGEDSEYYFVFEKTEKVEDYKIRIEKEEAALTEWEVKKHFLLEKYQQEAKEEKAKLKEANNNKFKDPDYIEYLRMQAKLKEKGIDV